MYGTAKSARNALKSKARRMATGSGEKVDSSDWTPAEPLNTTAKTGMRPISPRAYKKGGRVVAKDEGSANPARADKVSRNAKQFAEAKVNRNVKAANEERPGIKHVGGLKTGGRAKKMFGGPMADPREGVVKPNRFNFGQGAQGTPYKKGGKAEKHEDVKEDKALIKKMVKPSARTGKAIGGVLGETLSPALMLINAARGDKDKKKDGGRTGKKEGGFLRTLGDRVAGDLASDEAKKLKDKIMSGIGGDNYKKGGRTKRATGGQVFSGSGYPGKVPGVVGGRIAKAEGGKTKGKTNIVINIAAGKPAGQDGGMPPGMPPKGAPPALPPAPPAPPPAMPPGPPPGMPPMGAGGPPPGMPPGPPPGGSRIPPEMMMGRKAGGRVYRSYKDMDAGSGSGLGRLEKTEIQAYKPRKSGGRTYRSYKDMDAGAGSGKGRLEKTEIQSHK